MNSSAGTEILYFSLARLPTEKAHGLQICKVCEALAAHGAKVTLLHPSRRQRDPKLRTTDPFAYYGIQKNFELSSAAYFDPLALLEKYVPGPIVSVLYWSYNFVWTFFQALLRLRRRAKIVVYARDPIVIFCFTLLGFKVAAEIHTFRPGLQSFLLRCVRSRPNLLFISVITKGLSTALIAQGFESAKILLQPDAVDLAEFSAQPDKCAARTQLGLPLDQYFLGYVGRFETMGIDKGVPYLIQALTHLPAQVCLLCVGGPLEAARRFRQLAEQAGIDPLRAYFFDHIPHPQVPLWLSACDALCIPWGEHQHSAVFTSPLKLFEYMAAGRPIICSDLPALREVLSNQINALLVPPGDSAAIAQAAQRLLSDPALGQRLADQARQDVAGHTWNSRAAQSLERLSARAQLSA